MGAIKHYLNNLLCAASPDNGFAQDAIEHSIITGNLALTYNTERDLVSIGNNYDDIILRYRAERQMELSLA